MAEKYWHVEEGADAQNSAFPAKQDLSKPLANLHSLRFSKSERLCSTKLTDQLFSEGKAVHKNGFTLVYFFTEVPSVFPAQVLFSVPKKNFKHSPDRNRVKRLLRESYRHQKAELYHFLNDKQLQLVVAFIFKGKEIPKAKLVDESVAQLLAKLQDKTVALAQKTSMK